MKLILSKHSILTKHKYSLLLTWTTGNQFFRKTPCTIVPPPVVPIRTKDLELIHYRGCTSGMAMVCSRWATPSAHDYPHARIGTQAWWFLGYQPLLAGQRKMRGTKPWNPGHPRLDGNDCKSLKSPKRTNLLYMAKDCHNWRTTKGSLKEIVVRESDTI